MRKLHAKRNNLFNLVFLLMIPLYFFICTTEDEENFLLIVVIVILGLKAVIIESFFKLNEYKVLA